MSDDTRYSKFFVTLILIAVTSISVSYLMRPLRKPNRHSHTLDKSIITKADGTLVVVLVDTCQ